MLTASTTLANEITAPERNPIREVSIDFGSGAQDITDYTGSISLQRSLTTDVPDGTRLVVGYSTSQATIDLAGDNDHDGAWTWSPFNTASPFYGKRRVSAPVAIKLGFTTTAGDELLTRYAGWTRSVVVDGAARTAEVQAFDGSAHLRTQVQLPMATNLGHPGLDGRFFIDYILTANGINLADCDLEDSLNPLTATPYTTEKQDAWTLIQQIAAAELATAFFDEAGKFHFWNRQHFTGQSVNYTAKTVTVNGKTSPIPQVTSSRAIKTLTTNETTDGIANHIVVQYQPLVVQPFDWVWQTGAVRKVPAKSTVSINAVFDNPVQSLGTTVQVIPIGGDTGTNSGYRASTSSNGDGAAVENLQFVVTDHASSARIDITNPNRFAAFLVQPRADSLGHLTPGWDPTSPRPMLWIRGRPVTAGPNYTSDTNGATGATAEAKDTASIAAFGEIVYTLDGGGWIQDADTAATLAGDLLSLLARPIPYLGDVDVVADPRLQLGDRIELTDTTSTGLDSHAWIVGITDTFSTSDNTYTQTLTLRLCAGIGSMIWDHPTFGKWDKFKWDGDY
jgi:hypothetical protein